MFIFSTPVLIRHLWQFNTVVFLHRCLICALLFNNIINNDKTVICVLEAFIIKISCSKYRSIHLNLKLFTSFDPIVREVIRVSQLSWFFLSTP
jgi:hypothetical protein